MQIPVLVISDRPDEYVGKKGLVKTQIVTVIDQSLPGDARLVQPLEYSMTEEEKVLHAGKLGDKVITLVVREITPFGGRLRAKGKIVAVLTK